jgi:hypothetical protein
MNQDYYRAYIALIEEQQGYSVAGKRAFGKAIIEARGADGKLTVSVQGLKPKIFYKVYLAAKNVGASDNRYSGVCMGDLVVNEKGAGDIKVAFDAGNVGGTGFAANLFTTAIVMVDNAPVLTAPLAGYVGDKVFWKTGFEVFKKKITDAQPAARNGHAPQNEVPVPEAAEIVDIAEVVDVTENVDAVEVVEAAEIADTIDVTETAEVVDSVEIVETTEAAEIPSEPNIHTQFKEYAKEYVAETEREHKLEADAQLNELYRRNARMSPFMHKDPDIEWVRIAPDHVGLFKLPQIANSDFTITAFRRYRHLVLGRVGGGEKYILGVPDMYDPATAPEAEKLGFAFKRCDNAETAEKSYGYWLIVI